MPINLEQIDLDPNSQYLLLDITSDPGYRVGKLDKTAEKIKVLSQTELAALINAYVNSCQELLAWHPIEGCQPDLKHALSILQETAKNVMHTHYLWGTPGTEQALVPRPYKGPSSKMPTYNESSNLTEVIWALESILKPLLRHLTSSQKADTPDPLSLNFFGSVSDLLKMTPRIEPVETILVSVISDGDEFSTSLHRIQHLPFARSLESTLRLAIQNWLETEEGARSAKVENHGAFNWGDAILLIPPSFLVPYGVLNIDDIDTPQLVVYHDENHWNDDNDNDDDDQDDDDQDDDDQDDWFQSFDDNWHRDDSNTNDKVD